MKELKKIILPLGYSFILLIIASIILLSLFIGVGIFLLVCGVSDISELVVLGCLFIVISVAMLILFDIWLLFQCRIEFDKENLVICNFEVRGTVRFPKTIVPLCDLKKIEKIDNRILKFEYMNGEQNIIKLKSFSRKQITKIISFIASNFFIINGNK